MNQNLQSLVILDEFGKGTDEVSGSALLAAVLDHFSAQSGAVVLAISHMHAVFARFLADENENGESDGNDKESKNKDSCKNNLL